MFISLSFWILDGLRQVLSFHQLVENSDESLLVGQRSFVWYLFPHFEADYPNLWWSQLIWCLPQWAVWHAACVSWAAELRPAKDCSELGAVPTSALLHDRVRTIDFPRFAAVSCPDRSRVDAADVRCKNMMCAARSSHGRYLTAAAPVPTAACPPRRLTSKCWTSRTRTLPTLLSGSPTTSRHPVCDIPPKGMKIALPLQVTPLPSRDAFKRVAEYFHCHVPPQGLLALVHWWR